MTLRPHTEAILHAVPGAWACCIMGFDGLPLEACQSDGAPDEALTWLTELSAPLVALRRATLAGPARLGGAWADIALALPAGLLVARALGESHFVALMGGHEALSGRARYVLRREAAALSAALFPAVAGGPA